MSPEMILLIISMIGNVGIIFKKIRVIWTPCLVLDCRTEGRESQAELPEDEPLEPNIFRRAITKLTPRKKSCSQQQANPV